MWIVLKIDTAEYLSAIRPYRLNKYSKSSSSEPFSYYFTLPKVQANNVKFNTGDWEVITPVKFITLMEAKDAVKRARGTPDLLFLEFIQIDSNGNHKKSFHINNIEYANSYSK